MKEVIAKIEEKKVKVPKFKLISYTLKAVIPTGQYANIQPEITVQAATIEAAERAVMPYIETLFAKYRDGGVKPVEAAPVAPIQAQTAPTPVPMPAQKPQAPVIPTVTPAIVLTVPFTRAKSAIESCMSLDALKLVTDQIGKSTKLVTTEKNDLIMLALDKQSKLNGPAKV